MKIKITQSCTGHKFTFTQGETREVSEYIGNDLIGAGFAELVPKPKTEGTGTVEVKVTKRKTTSKAKVKADVDA